MNIVHSVVNCVIFHELCDRRGFEIDCAKSHHRVISESLYIKDKYFSCKLDSLVVLVCMFDELHHLVFVYFPD